MGGWKESGNEKGITAGDAEGGRLEPDSLTSGARKMTLLKSTGKKIEQFLMKNEMQKRGRRSGG